VCQILVKKREDEMEKETKEAQVKFFEDLENVAHEKLMKLPEDVAFLFFQKLLELVMSGERERSWQLFFDWLANKKTAEGIVSELEAQDE
jgi:hypothetical protein